MRNIIAGIRLSALALAVGLAACSTLGRGFDPHGMAGLVPGDTTLAQAVVLLKATPSETYRAADGSFNALWYHGMRGPVDTHFGRSALLAFDTFGRFERVMDTSGIVVDEAAAARQRQAAVHR